MQTPYDFGVWYTNHKKMYWSNNSTTVEKENGHWDWLFTSDQQQLILPMILQLDNARIMERYITQLNNQQTDPYCTQQMLEKEWKKIACLRSKKCAAVVHQYLSQDGFSSATVKSIEQRLDHMIDNHMVEQALHLWDERCNGALSWKLLQTLMSFYSNIGDETWETSLKSLDVYLKRGGNWNNPNDPNQHILLTQWPFSLWRENHTNRLTQLFERGVTLEHFNPTQANKQHLSGRQHWNDVQVYNDFEAVWNEFMHGKISTALTDTSAPNTKVRKI